MRYGLIISLLALAFLAGCRALHVDSRRAAAPVWPTEGESPSRTHAVTASIEPPLVERWTFNAGAGFGSVSPLIAGDVLLVATRKGEVQAVDLDTGGRMGETSFGESIEGTPALQDGVLYVPVAWGSTALYAYDLVRASTKWRVKDVPINAGLLVDGNAVIAADVEGHVRAYDLSDGHERWSITLSDSAGVHAAPLLAGEYVVICDDAGGVTAVRATDGSLVWATRVDAPVHATPAASEELLFIPTTRGKLIALSPETGVPQWEITATSDRVYVASPAVGEWEVVFGASDGMVRAVNVRTGALLWETDAEAAVTAPPLITDSVVYAGTMRNKLMGLSRGNGSVLWETELEGRMKSAFAAKGEQLIVLSEPRTVYLFEESSDRYAVDLQ